MFYYMSNCQDMQFWTADCKEWMIISYMEEHKGSHLNIGRKVLHVGAPVREVLHMLLRRRPLGSQDRIPETILLLNQTAAEISAQVYRETKSVADLIELDMGNMRSWPPSNWLFIRADAGQSGLNCVDARPISDIRQGIS